MQSPTGALLAASNWEGQVFLVDTATAVVVHKFEAHAMPVRRVRFSADGRRLLTCADDRYAKLFDLTDLSDSRLTHSLTGHTNWLLCGDVVDETVITSAIDSTINAYDLRQADKAVQTIRCDAPVWSCRFGDTAKQFVATGDDHALRLFSFNHNE